MRCVLKNCSSTEFESIYSSSTNTEYLRSSAKLARPRRWLEDLTCHQCTHQRRVERRVEPRGAQRPHGRRHGRFRSGQRAIGIAGAPVEESRENSYRVDAGPNAARKRVRCTIAPLNNKTLHPRTH